MTHDFAKKRQSEPPSSPIPWVSMLITLAVVAVFAGFIYYLWIIKPQADEYTQNLKQQQGQESPELNVQLPDLPDGKEGDDSDPRFTFYRVLPELEVVSKHIQKMVKQRHLEQQQNQPDRPKPSAYFLQTDSFKNWKDADARRAELLLMGFDVNVKKVGLKTGTWYRVTVGPFDNKKSLHRAQNILANNNIMSQVRSVYPES